MWFKRRKKTERDQALSESLRSLQSLLNETGRREPRLDNPEDPLESGDPDQQERALAARTGAATNEASVATEPAPPEPGNRWGDLTLGFDAEPVMPRPAMPARDADHDGLQAPGGWPGDRTAMLEPDTEQGSDTELELELELDTEPDREPDREPDVEPDVESVIELDTELDTEPGLETDREDDRAAAAASDAETPATDWQAPNPGGAVGSWAAEPPAATSIDGAVDGSAPPAAATVTGGDTLEGQLHLPLEEMAQADEKEIPTLTEAVFVPDASAGIPPPREPNEARHDQDRDVNGDIEILRTRLQHLRIDDLSAERKTQLRDTLERLLGELH